MTAIRLHGPKDLRPDQVSEPGPPDTHQVTVRVGATGICGSDLHWYVDGRIGTTAAPTPLVLGHEFAGTVTEIGPQAVAADGEVLHIGDRVAVDPNIACGACRWCLEGNPNLCNNARFLGQWPDDGSLQERIVVPARVCHRLPAEIGLVDAALLEPLGVALFSVDLTHLRVGHSLVILGAGPIGLLALQLCRRAGAAWIAVADKLPWRLELARRFGADLTVDATREDVVDRVAASAGREGVDRVIEAAWADETVAQAVQLAAPGGRVILVGIPSQDQIVVPASAMRRKGLTLAACRRMRHTYPRAIALVHAGLMELPALVSHRLPLVEAARGFALNANYEDEVVKCMIVTED